MNCTCKVSQRRLIPGVFNLKQHLNGSETMVWELDNCTTNQGTCDLRNYDAFLTLCVGGKIDEIMLTKQQTGDTIKLVWNVGRYGTALTGEVQYQIVFRNAQFDTLGVISTDPEANGVYRLTNQNATGEHRIFVRPGNGYKIKWDATNGRWALYKADGATVVDFQTLPSSEPHCGAWGSVLVGNNEAAAWYSDKAIIRVSESIAADESITANYPTILRQMFHGMQNICSKSGVTALTDWVLTTYWYGYKAPYYVNLHDQFSIPAGCQIVDVRLQKENDDGTFTTVDSIEIVEVDGKATLYCNEKVDGKITVSIRSAGGSYVFVDEKSVGHVGGWRIDKAGIAAELPEYDGEKAGFVFYATDTGMYYRKQSDASGDWSEPYPFRGEQGVPGETGRPGRDGVTEVFVSNAIQEHNESANPHENSLAKKQHAHPMTDVTGLGAAMSAKATVANVDDLAKRVIGTESGIAALDKSVGDINTVLAAIVGE